MTSPAGRQRDLKRAYKERPKPAGVFQIKNTVTGRALLGSSLNLDGSLNRHRFMLGLGSHYNKAMQAEWKEHGAQAFRFEILAVVEVHDDPAFNLAAALEALEARWIGELQPFGPKGYNTDAQIRDV